MPNQKGGKKYKKSKQTGNISKPFPEKLEDQMYARVLRNLGGRNMLTYCNDGKIRLCHICGGMKKFDWLRIGDLVIISLRGFEKKLEVSAMNKYERGDIIAKYEHDHVHQLKKLPDINKNLFLALETVDGTKLAEIGSGSMEKLDHLLPEAEDEGGIVFENSDKEDTKENTKEESSSEEEKDFNIDDI